MVANVYDLTDMYIKAMSQEGETGSVANGDTKAILNEGDLANLVDITFFCSREQKHHQTL